MAARRVCGDYIRAHPETFGPAMLGGRDAVAYAAHIQDPAVWGGGVDMRALAEHFGVQVAAVNVQTRGGVNVFGEDRPFLRRIYVIYDGLHFDALCRVSRSSGRPDATVFAPSDDCALQEAVAGAWVHLRWGPFVLMIPPRLPLLPSCVEVAAEACARHEFTDLAHFTLRCLVCGDGITGESHVQSHARETGHTNFAEYR